MAKTSTKTSARASTAKASSAKPAAAPQDDTESQAASGADGKAEDAAAHPAAPEAKASEDKVADAVDPAGTTDGSAPSVEESREQTEAASTDRKDEAEEGNQPEVTAQPPVAEAIYSGPLLIVKGPKKGRWRAGLFFPREETALQPRELGKGTEGAESLLAILRDPALSCSLRHSDGREEPFPADEIEELEKVIATVRSAEAQGIANAADADVLAGLLGSEPAE